MEIPFNWGYRVWDCRRLQMLELEAAGGMDRWSCRVPLGLEGMIGGGDGREQGRARWEWSHRQGRGAVIVLTWGR